VWNTRERELREAEDWGEGSGFVVIVFTLTLAFLQTCMISVLQVKYKGISYENTSYVQCINKVTYINSENYR
jgi:hypothetical protein